MTKLVNPICDGCEYYCGTSCMKPDKCERYKAEPGHIPHIHINIVEEKSQVDKEELGE